MGQIKEVSEWSISLKKTNKGYQARVFKRWYDKDKKERPTYYNRRELADLLAHIRDEVIPKLEDNFIPIKPKDA